MNVSIKSKDLTYAEGKVKRFGVIDDTNTCIKILLTEDEAKAISEKMSIPSPFGFADEHIDYTYKEIWV